MCYRYLLKAGDVKIAAHKLGAALEKEFATRYNIAPGVKIPALRQKAGSDRNELAGLKWGLVPSWAQNPAEIGTKMANARADGIADKPSFRSAFKSRRCIVPASGFYEWETDSRGKKLPWLFGLGDGSPLLFAGLWDSWQAPDGETIESCAIITTTPNDLIGRIHDRMPVVLSDEAARQWLAPCDHPREQLLPLLAPLPAGQMTGFRVDPWVNSVAHDDERCIAPGPAASAEAGDGQLGLAL